MARTSSEGDNFMANLLNQVLEKDGLPGNCSFRAKRPGRRLHESGPAAASPERNAPIWRTNLGGRAPPQCRA
jgi:hypothetical protein